MDYHEDDGEWVADVPRHGPCGADGEPCRIHRHGRRERKFGPGHPLMVVRCVAHGRVFTLYPRGWFPWGRKPLVASEREWRVTLFAAALLAAEGTLWPEEHDDERMDVPRATTQRRRIAYGGRLLGLDGDAKVGEAAREVLGVGLERYNEARRQWSQAADRRRRGQVIATLLDAVPDDPLLMGRMLGLLSTVTDGRLRWVG